MSLETDLQEPIQSDQPAPTDQAAAPADEDAQLDAELESQAIDIPDGDKLVPLSAVTTVRAKYRSARDEAREAKEQAERAAAEAKALRDAFEAVKPDLEALKALKTAQSMVMTREEPHQPTQPDPEEVTELEAIARDYDFYKGDGTADLEKARRILERDRKIATQAAQQAVAPLAQQTMHERSQAMLVKALNTKTGPGGKPIDVDPDVLKDIWSRLDPALTATKEGAQWALLTAVGASVMTAKPQPKNLSVSEPPPPPLYTERAGGKDGPANVVLNDGDKRVAKDMGMTEKEYAEYAAKMPWAKK